MGLRLQNLHKKQEIPNSSITPELVSLPEWDVGAEEAMQIDLLPNLPPAGVKISLPLWIYFQDTFSHTQ